MTNFAEEAVMWEMLVIAAWAMPVVVALAWGFLFWELRRPRDGGK